MKSTEATLCHGNCGWYVEWFREDETTPLGYRVAHWYGTREGCEERMRQPPPGIMFAAQEGRCPDAATASGMFD
jgi:hypothetical protein